MLDKLIIIKDDKDYQCSTFEEIVKYLINENYYNLTKQEKENIMMKKAIEKAVDKGLKIIKNNNQIKDLNKSFIIIDEMTVILSIIKDQSKIVLLERKDSNIFNKYIKIPNNNDNYAIINTFATQALKNYLATKMGTVLPNQA
ncbi:MAG TPA: hypothetical protein OIM49_07510 [Clostridiaceae bacterium]|jgi:hypothetical protein|nr:hypothetical protein [Clostridiaceae bacterium]